MEPLHDTTLEPTGTRQIHAVSMDINKEKLTDNPTTSMKMSDAVQHDDVDDPSYDPRHEVSRARASEPYGTKPPVFLQRYDRTKIPLRHRLPIRLVRQRLVHKHFHIQVNNLREHHIHPHQRRKSSQQRKHNITT